MTQDSAPYRILAADMTDAPDLPPGTIAQHGADIPPRTRCARCGLIEVCGERDDEPVCPRCLGELLQEVTRERDEARADWRCLSDGLSAALEMDPDHPMPMTMLASVRALAVACKAAEDERGELREASRALVEALESTHGDWPRFCDEPRCCCLAMHDDGDQVACDEHQWILVDGDVEDLSYATTWRRLVALAKEGGRG